MAALVYSRAEKPDDILRRFTEDRLREGVRVAGIVQHGHCQDKAGLFVTSYPDRNIVRLSQDLGIGSASCGLDAGRLVERRRAFAQAHGDRSGQVLLDSIVFPDEP
ncbi:MAG: DUF2478 domain-containing protein, partial [Chryseolinea sp.]